MREGSGDVYPDDIRSVTEHILRSPRKYITHEIMKFQGQLRQCDNAETHNIYSQLTHNQSNKALKAFT
jgi:hypothetical protein